MTVLTADTVADTHTYIGEHRPDWSASMANIQNQGGPWPCATCDGLSLLCYRCSQCGAELDSSASTEAIQ